MTYRISFVHPDGTLTLVGTCRERPNIDVDLSQEGLRYTRADVAAWCKPRFEAALAKEVPSRRGTVSKERQRRLMTTIRKLPNRPRINDFRPLGDSPQLMDWLKRIDLPQWKRDMFLQRMWGILTGNIRGKHSSQGKGSVETFRTILSVLLATADLGSLRDALFSYSVVEAVNVDSIVIPAPLLPLLHVCSRVDGRGEALSTFMFRDVIWLPGTGKHDLQGTDGTSVWHVKELKTNKIRMGSSFYASSALRDDLVKLATDTRWVDTGTNPKFSVTKKMVLANAGLLSERFGSVDGFYASLNALLQDVESGSRGVLFFKGDRAIVRSMKDVKCVGATKGDLEVSPSPLSSNHVADVAA